MTELLIFDLGKVIFDLSFERVFQSWAHNSGISSEQIKRKFTFTGACEEFETGKITPAVFRSQVSDLLGMSVSDELFDEGWSNLYLDIYPQIESLLPKLKQQFRLIALTNTNIIHEPVWRRKYAKVLGHFDKIYSSHELGLRKPDPEIYFHVMNEARVKPADALFLDDNPENVKGAEACGIRSVLVSDPDQMIRDLSVIINLPLNG